MFKIFAIVIVAVIVGNVVADELIRYNHQVEYKNKLKLRNQISCRMKPDYYINGIHGLDVKNGIPCKTILGEEEYNRVKNN